MIATFFDKIGQQLNQLLHSLENHQQKRNFLMPNNIA